MTQSDYEKRRNALIPRAEREANDTIQRKDFDSNDDYYDAWNRNYFKNMNRLAKAEGLI